MSSDEHATPLLPTPLTTRHEALGAKLVPFAGYSMPIQYSGLVKEHQAVRQTAGLFDVCHMGEIRLRGSGASAFVQHLVTNDLNRIRAGQAMYTPACRAGGGMVDDLIVYKNDSDDLLIVCNASNREKFWTHLLEQKAGFHDVSLVDESDATGLIALQGPRAFSILSRAEPRCVQLREQLRPCLFIHI